MNSTPVNSAAIIRLTALLPPPPRPMTLIFAACGTSSSSKSGRRVRSLSITSSSVCPPVAASRRRRSERLTSKETSGGGSPRPVLEDVIQQAGRASRETSDPGVIRRRGRLGLSPPADAVERQARRGRVDRALHDVGEAAHAERHAASYRLIEDRLGELGHALHERGASGDDDAGTNAVSAHPYRFFMTSAEGDGVRRPIAMSFEMWSPPSGRMAVCQIAPLRKSATSVVPPPMSTTTTPCSFSSSYRTASPEASGSRDTSCTRGAA